MAYFEELSIWQQAKELTKEIYEMMQNSRDWGLRDQIQRASVSIMNNIAEGSEKWFCTIVYPVSQYCKGK